MSAVIGAVWDRGPVLAWSLISERIRLTVINAQINDRHSEMKTEIDGETSLVEARDFSNNSNEHMRERVD